MELEQGREMARKIRLLEAQKEAEQEVKMYKDLLHKAEASLVRINQELSDSFKAGNSRYTNGELAAVRRGILEGLREGRWTKPRELIDLLPNLDSDLIMRELHKLANNHRANVTWNKRHGPASAYIRW